MLSAEYLFAIGLRSGLALLFGVLFGIAALVLFFFVLPGLYTPPMWMLVFVTGTGSSVAGFLAYFKPETNWKIVATGFCLRWAEESSAHGLDIYGRRLSIPMA